MEFNTALWQVIARQTNGEKTLQSNVHRHGVMKEHAVCSNNHKQFSHCYDIVGVGSDKCFFFFFCIISSFCGIINSFYSLVVCIVKKTTIQKKNP